MRSITDKPVNPISVGTFGTIARYDDDTNIDYTFSVRSDNNGLPMVDVCLDDTTTVSMYIDTCSSLNIIDENIYKQLNPKPVLKERNSLAWGFQSTSPIKFKGEFNCLLKYEKTSVDAKISVVVGAERCLLSYKTSDELGLVRIPFYENVPLVNSISRERNLTYWKEKYPSVFNEKPGKLKDVQIMFDIDESVKPVVTKRYPMPFHIREEVEKMVQQGVADDIFEKASRSYDLDFESISS